jgi:hypothetical protein
MWKLTPADLLQLKGGGGEPFVHFMDRLIRAEAACGGLAQSEIATQLRVNIKDGGVDTEVKNRIPQDMIDWFGVPTCWQFTAGDTKDLKEEIQKPYSKKLIEQGYGYRLCLLADLPPEKVRGWEEELKKDALIINPNAPDPRVVHGGHLLLWAERFPALVALLRNWTQGGFHWEAWRDNCRAVTHTYVPNPAWAAVRQQILQHGQLYKPPVGGEACLPIGGAAGVGKTRLVFETLNELQEAPSLVLYLADEQEARAAATAIVNTPGQTAILVADECSPQTRHFLNENLRGHTKRIRMVCLDNTGERLASVTGQVWLTADSLTNTEAILAANYPDVPDERRRQYARFTKGFVRFAADMCRHDPELAAGEMSRTLESVERYVRNRLGDSLAVISAIALFHKIGFKEDVSAELDTLCGLTGCSKQHFLDAVRSVRESPGFVVQAGRYWYVTPDIVAPVLFAEGWQRCVSADLGGFLKELPSHLMQQVLDRVATHGAKEVRDHVGNFFRGWFLQLTARDLAVAPVTTLAAALIEASPEEYLPLLRAIIETAETGELHQIQPYSSGARWGPRRTLVWLLERLVSFPEYFENCEACLFRLAVEESEPQFGNNATAIWANLFSVYLSGTATPFQQRVQILAKRAASPEVSEARIAFGGVSRALQRSEGHILGEPVVAGRLRPDDWHPSTSGEERDCYRSVLAICGEHLRSPFSDELHRLAFDAIAQSLYHLLYVGVAEELRWTLTRQSVDEEEARKLLQILDSFLERQHTDGHATVNERALDYIRGVQEWSDQFRRTDFGGRLREVCARAPWDQRFSQDASRDRDETDELADLIVKQPSLLTSELDWLASPEAQSAERLGFALGRIDGVGDCGQMIFEHAITHKAAPLLRGYIRGMVFAQRAPSAELLESMARLESAHPELATDILVYGGDSFDALNRILRLVDSQAVPARHLSSLGGLGRRHLTSDEVNRVLPYFTRTAQGNEAGTLLAGVRFLATHLLFESRDSVQSCLTSETTRSLAWQLVEGVLPFLGGNDAYVWTTILKKTAAFDPDRAARVLAQALLTENYSVREAAEIELTQLVKTHPESVMAGLGSALLDPERGWRLQVHRCRDLVAQLPAQVVIDWVGKHGLDGARAIARHLPIPYLDKAGTPIVSQALDVILREYDDDEVFANFVGGSHSGEAWWGNGADEFRHAADTAKKFLTHPNHRIREWAKNEANYRHWLAEREDQEEEERVLPL